MTVDEFLVWAEGRPGRYELVDGRVFAMAPERIGHVRGKFSAVSALASAITRAGLPCEAFTDGAAIRVDGGTALEPDASVRCGEPLDADSIEVPDPVIVVEVLSPSTRSYDTGAKLVRYFRVPGLFHYLIMDVDRRVVVHHRRDGEAIATRILGSGSLRLDPPGLEMRVEDLFGTA